MKITIKTSVLLLLGAFLVFINLPLHKALRLTDSKSDRLLMAFACQDGDQLIISFIHSVNKRPVHDYLKITGERLLVHKSRYDSFGAGMPENAPDGMIFKMEENGTLELTNINKLLDEFTLFNGVIARHTINFNGKTVTLTDIIAPGQPLTFKVGRASYYELLGGLIYDN